MCDQYLLKSFASNAKWLINFMIIYHVHGLMYTPFSLVTFLLLLSLFYVDVFTHCGT